MLAQDRLLLPSPPEIATRVGELCKRDDVSVSMLAEVVSADPAICVRLIRASNSALVRGRNEVSTVHEAIMRLGFSFTRSLVYSVAMEQMFSAQRNPQLVRRLRQCWSESVQVAALAEVLAKHCTLVPPPVALLAGLVHQIGALPVIRLAEQEESFSQDPDALESVIRSMHAKVGRLVLQAWNFAPEIVEVPEGYMQPGRSHAGPGDLLDVLIVAVLETQQRGGGGLKMISRTSVPAYQKLDIDPEGDVMEDTEIRNAYESVLSSLAGR